MFQDIDVYSIFFFRGHYFFGAFEIKKDTAENSCFFLFSFLITDKPE